MSGKTYRSEGIIVTFDMGRCIHSKGCIHNLPEVFDVEKRPWIQPDNSNPDAIAETVMSCPTGALQFAREDGGDEEPVPKENVVTVERDGPLYIRGDVEIKEYDGTTFLEDTRVALCRCGDSQNKPFCDNSHKNSGFRDTGALEGNPYPGSAAPGGRLEVKLTPNGPLFFKGEFEVRYTEGGPAYRENKAALCRCGRSGGKPFCDGTHGGIGWRDD